LHAAPLFGFRSSRRRLLSVGLSLPGSSARDVSSLRLRCSRSRLDLVLSVSPDRSPALRLRFACLLELSSLFSNPPCSTHQLTARCLAMILVREADLRPLGCPRVRFSFSRSSCSSVARRARRVRSTPSHVIDSFTMSLSSRPAHSAVARFVSLSRRACRSVSRSTPSSHDALTAWLRHAVSLFHDALTAWLPTP
jgi:hypothetical protein